MKFEILKDAAVIFYSMYSVLIFCCYLEFEAIQVKRRVFWRDVTQLSYVTSQDPSFYLTRLHNKSSIELGSEAVIHRSSVTKSVVRNFTKFTGKHLCQSLFLIKLEASKSATLSKKRLPHRCFPVNFPKFLTTSFVTDHPRWLLL